MLGRSLGLEYSPVKVSTSIAVDGLRIEYVKRVIAQCTLPKIDKRAAFVAPEYRIFVVSVWPVQELNVFDTSPKVLCGGHLTLQEQALSVDSNQI